MKLYQTGDAKHIRPSAQSIVDNLHKNGLLKYYSVNNKYFGWYLVGVKRGQKES